VDPTRRYGGRGPSKDCALRAANWLLNSSNEFIASPGLPGLSSNEPIEAVASSGMPVE